MVIVGCTSSPMTASTSAPYVVVVEAGLAARQQRPSRSAGCGRRARSGTRCDAPASSGLAGDGVEPRLLLGRHLQQPLVELGHDGRGARHVGVDRARLEVVEGGLDGVEVVGVDVAVAEGGLAVAVEAVESVTQRGPAVVGPGRPAGQPGPTTVGPSAVANGEIQRFACAAHRADLVGQLRRPVAGDEVDLVQRADALAGGEVDDDPGRLVEGRGAASAPRCRRRRAALWA